MNEDHVGYLDFDGKIVHFRSARCAFKDGELDAEAEGPKCRLHLYGIPFPGAVGIADLAGRSYGPADVPGDPIAEGGIETRRMWLSFKRLAVRCRGYDPAAGQITVSFQADVRDAESGRSGTVDGGVRCRVAETLWSSE